MSAAAFRTEEIQGLHHARQIMIDNMLDPPTLPELARAVGLNVKKIKTGFRTLFGTTVYGFLNGYRMERARQLLRTELSSVSQAAWAVGYVNVSHFGSAFYRQFGVRPGEYLKALRKEYAASGEFCPFPSQSPSRGKKSPLSSSSSANLLNSS
jgi:AraC-like DNA-binding protein